jgi:hypothetical protein
MKTIIIAFLVFFAVAEGIALATAGTEDFGAFILWTIPSGAISAFLGTVLARSTQSIGRIPGMALSAVSGCVFGVLWTYLVGRLLGPWIGAFGAPVLLCWISAGATSFFAARLLSGFPVAKALPFIGAFAIISSIAVFAIPIILERANNNQQLLTFVFRYTPGENELQIDENNPSSWSHDARLTTGEKSVLIERFRKGHLRLETRGRNGAGPESRAIIVMERPIKAEVRLAQPDRSTIFYFQQNERFDLRPDGAPTLKRFIRLASRDYSSEGTNYTAVGYLIDSWDGSATGSDIMRWDKK